MPLAPGATVTHRLVGTLLFALLCAVAFSGLLADKHFFAWPFLETFVVMAALAIGVTLVLPMLPSARRRRSAVNAILGGGIAVVVLGFILRGGDSLQWRLVPMLVVFGPALALGASYAVIAHRRR